MQGCKLLFAISTIISKTAKSLGHKEQRAKFQSSWDLTPKEIAKNEKKLKKKKHKRKAKITTKGLLEFMNLVEPSVPKEQTTLAVPSLESLAGEQNKSSTENDNQKSNLDLNPELIMSKSMIDIRQLGSGNTADYDLITRCNS